MGIIKKTASEFGNCNNCKCKRHLSQLFSYVDGNNIAITRNSKNLCESCYIEFYNNKVSFINFYKWLKKDKESIIDYENGIIIYFGNIYTELEIIEKYKNAFL